MSNPIKLALVGCGGISSRHVNSYRDIQGLGCHDFTVVACCDPVEANAVKRAEEIGAFQSVKPQVFSSVEDLIKADIAEAADVCVPHAFHHSTAIPLLEAGLHVQLEKPLGITVRASRKIIEAAQVKGVVLATAENTRRCLAPRACRWAIAEEGLIGEPRAVHIQHIQPQDFDYTNPAFKWRAAKLLTGGGMIMDSGAHLADMMLYMFGEVEQVSCSMATHEEVEVQDVPRLGTIKADCEDSWHAVFTFKSGLTATWSYSRVFPGKGISSGHYYGSKGMIADQGFVMHCFEGGGELTTADGATRSPKDIEKAYLESLSEDKRAHLFPLGLTNGFRIEIYDFIRAIKTGQSVEMDGLAGLKAKALSMACYESAEAGTPVKYQDVLEGKISAYQDPIDEYWKL